MKKAKRWKYYCDFCKKSGGSKFHMEKHEKSCTANPNRKCGLCEMVGNDQPETKDMVKVIKKYTKGEKIIYDDEDFHNSFKEGATAEIILKELKKITDCPACILTAIRISKTSSLFLKEDFDFHSEREDFFNTHKDEPPEYYY